MTHPAFKERLASILAESEQGYDFEALVADLRLLQARARTARTHTAQMPAVLDALEELETHVRAWVEREGLQRQAGPLRSAFATIRGMGEGLRNGGQGAVFLGRQLERVEYALQALHQEHAPEGPETRPAARRALM